VGLSQAWYAEEKERKRKGGKARQDQLTFVPGAPFQQQIEPLMLKYSVDMYLSGHMHMYERTFPLIDGKVIQAGNVYVNPKAPVHVVQATGTTRGGEN
jgi:hypothetical protein